MRPVREAAAALAGVGGGDQAAAHVGHAHAHAGLWRTPTPYLFLGFALMMGLIAIALLMLFCTRRKPSVPSRRPTEEASAWGILMAPLDREPKVVLIMAGDDMPSSFLASARPFSFGTVVDAGLPRKMDTA